MTTKTYVYPNAIVTVEFADVSEEENERRMKLIHDAARDLIISTMKNKKRLGITDETDAS